jgi:DNA polymerase
MLCKIQVRGEGPKRAKLMLVGEAPGREEIEQKRPFVGRAGRFLNKTLVTVGINRKKCYITNVVKFRPTRVLYGKIKDRAPTDAEMAACAPLLKREILGVRPRLIVLLGATALRELVGPEEKLSHVHGRVLKSGRWRFLPTYHPAVAMRNRKFRYFFVLDLRKAQKLASDQV